MILIVWTQHKRGFIKPPATSAATIIWSTKQAIRCSYDPNGAYTHWMDHRSPELRADYRAGSPGRHQLWADP